jgi:hypothetical protein
VKALIGHRRFIGRNLARHRTWDACCKLQDTDTIRGCSVERVMGAGLTSNRRLANDNPGCNRSNMLSRTNALGQDVRMLYGRNPGGDEADLMSAVHVVGGSDSGCTCSRGSAARAARDLGAGSARPGRGRCRRDAARGAEHACGSLTPARLTLQARELPAQVLDLRVVSAARGHVTGELLSQQVDLGLHALLVVGGVDGILGPTDGGSREKLLAPCVGQ